MYCLVRGGNDSSITGRTSEKEGGIWGGDGMRGEEDERKTGKVQKSLFCERQHLKHLIKAF